MLFITEGSHGSNSNKAGTWRVELMQRPRRAAVPGLLPVPYSVCFLTELTSFPWMAHSTIMWFLTNDHSLRKCFISRSHGVLKTLKFVPVKFTLKVQKGCYCKPMKSTHNLFFLSLSLYFSFSLF